MTTGRLPRIPGALAALLVLSAAARAQAPETVTQDSLLAPVEAEGLDSLRVKMERSGWAGSFSGYVFKGPAQEKGLPDGVVEVPEARFQPWQGRTVRFVHVERINVFTPNPVGTPSPKAGIVSRLGNGLHLDTKEFMIRGFVLVKEGEPLNPRKLVDTERLLRERSYILDADIEVIPVEDSDEVDVVIVTRDRFSIGARAKVRTPTKWNLELFERNLLGRGIDWNNRFDVNTVREEGERADYTGTLRRENWRGTFLNLSGGYSSRREIESTAAGISRTTDIPEVRTVGHVIGTWTRTREIDPHRLDTQDVWLGRDLYTRDPGDGSAVSRLFLHARSVRTEFHRRPDVQPDSLRGLHDQVFALATVSWSSRSFRKDRLVRGWGRTEDVPIGYRFKLTGGYRWGEFEEHPYLGVELREASFHSAGYVVWGAEAGGFLRDGKMENSAIGGLVGWYGKLIRLGGTRVRPIAVVRAAHVFRPLEDTGISIGSRQSLLGLSDTVLPGHTRFVAAMENTAFTPWAPWGFRFAMFGSAAAGTVAAEPKHVPINRWFSSLTFGLRIFNEHLVFDAVELSVSFYPSTPSGVTGEPYFFGTTRQIEFFGFDIDPPQIVRLL